MALGEQKAIEKAQQIEDIEVYFILADTLGGYCEYLSEGMKGAVVDKER